MEKNMKKEYVYVYVCVYMYLTESLCCTQQTKTTLQINYASIKEREEKEKEMVRADMCIFFLIKALLLSTFLTYIFINRCS